ncbi:MAG: FAD-dependent oxidoreductase, partial [Actinobacteria bacterium]|nr:FAD-dependent oxidoreductase [Actinomycetota bacterium]
RTVVSELQGEQSLEGVGLQHLDDGSTDVRAAGLFSFIGAEPATPWLNGAVATDDRGFIRTDRDLDESELGPEWQIAGRDPLPYETSKVGLFAVGDVRHGSMKRVAAAVGEGSAAIRSVHDHLAFSH